MPRGRMPGILRMMEDGDPDGFVLDGAVVIAPGAMFAPGLVIQQAAAEDDMAITRFLAVTESHAFGDANTKGAFFGVTKNDWLIACLDGDLEIKHALGPGPIVNSKGALIRASDVAIRSNPFATGANDAGFLPGFNIQKFIVDDLSRLGAFR